MIDRSVYRAHALLAEPARATAQLWRLAIGVVLIAGVFLLSLQFVENTLRMLIGPARFGTLRGPGVGGSAVSVLYLLFSFGLITLGVAVALRMAHHRGLSEVLGPRDVFRRQFVAVAAMMVLLHAAIFLLPPWGMGVPLERNLALDDWLLVLPLGLAAVLVQVSSEEILFRGYLQQQLAARFASPVVWLVVPSVLFALGHYMPQAGEMAVFIAIWSGLFGLAAADLTGRAGTLAPAIALHMANNVLAILFVSMPDGLSGLSLYYSPFDVSDSEAVRAWLPVEFMMILVCWLAARLAIRR